MRRHLRRDHGASAVEFALVVPLLLLLVFGIINFGVVFTQALSLNNAIRQGAREAVVAGSAGQQTCAGVVTAVRDAAKNTLLMDETKIQVSVATQSASGTLYTPGPCGTNPDPTGSNSVCANSYKSGGFDSIVVTATYPAKFIVPWPWVPGASGTIGSAPNLTSKAVYLCEYSPSS